MVSKKEKAFALFDQGYAREDPEVKKVVSNYQYRRNLWDMWRESRGVAPELVVEEPEGVATSATPDSEGDDVELETKVQPTEPKLKAPYKVSPKEISIGNIKIPWSDWGYSSVFNLLVVAATYEEIRKPSKDGGIGYPGKVGDFCAECVKLYRRIFDFDRIKEEEYAGQGVQQIPGGIEEENNE